MGAAVAPTVHPSDFSAETCECADQRKMSQIEAATPFICMPRVLSYAQAERTIARRHLAPIATGMAVASSALLIAATFFVRYTLASYGPPGKCGTPRASLEMQLYELPILLIIPSVVAACLARRFNCGESTARVALCVAILGWAVCAFVG